MITGSPDPHDAPNSASQRHGGVRGWFRHAFAVEEDKPLEPTAEEVEVADRLLLAVVRRRMTVPAILMLESSRPMNYVGAQTLHFFAPFAEILVSPDRYRTFTLLLERRGSIDYLLRRLGEIEEEETSKRPAAAGKLHAETPKEDGTGKANSLTNREQNVHED